MKWTRILIHTCPTATPESQNVVTDGYSSVPIGHYVPPTAMTAPHESQAFRYGLPPASAAVALDVVNEYESNPITPYGGQTFVTDGYNRGGLPNYVSEESMDYSSSSFQLFIYVDVYSLPTNICLSV